MSLRQMDVKRVAETVVGVLSLLGIAVLLLLTYRTQEAPPLTSSGALQGEAGPAVWPALVITGDGLGADAPLLARGIAASGSATVHPGAGFVSGEGLAKAVIADVQGQDVAAVVVQGGEADVDQRAGSVGMAALDMVDALRASLSPHASITLVGPVPDGEPDADLLRVRDELARTAAFKRVHFVDPVELGLRQGQADLATQLAGVIAPFVPESKPVEAAAG